MNKTRSTTAIVAALACFSITSADAFRSMRQNGFSESSLLMYWKQAQDEGAEMVRTRRHSQSANCIFLLEKSRAIFGPLQSDAYYDHCHSVWRDVEAGAIPASAAPDILTRRWAEMERLRIEAEQRDLTRRAVEAMERPRQCVTQHGGATSVTQCW